VNLTGTRRLVRFVVQADRVRLLVWILGVFLLVWGTAASVKGLYPTQADLDKAAAPLYGNAAVIAFNGPTNAIDTLGGQIVFQLGSFGYAAVGLMGMFLVGRHTRGDEEAGRTELLQATVVGRYAPAAAALFSAAGALVLTGVLITLSFLTLGLAVAGSVAYGAAMALFGIFFACVTVLMAQVTQHACTAYALTGVVLGVTYLVRVVGDIGSGTLSWLSPMGWAMSVKAFAGERWWPLLLLAAGGALLIIGAVALAARRDLGGGLVPPRPGPRHAARWVVRPTGFAFRLQGLSLLGWLAGLAFFGIAYGSVGKDVADLIGDNQTLADIVAQRGGSLTDSYFATALLTMALITGGFTVAAVLRLRSEETAGRAEPLLATDLSRVRWALTHLTVAAVGSMVVMAGIGLAMGIAYAVSIGDFGDLGRIVGAAVAFAPALWVLAGVALALFGLVPRATALAWGVLGGCLFVGLFAQLVGLPQWVVDLSPFQHVPAMPADGFALAPIAILTALAAALSAAGLAGFRRRDAGY
jgi:polyether ionophore transport system permease protein